MTFPTDPIYKLLKNLQGEVWAVTKDCGSYRLDIPFVEDNTDYQEYLAWVAEGNTPEEAN